MTQNLKSIQSYLDRKKARRDTVRTEARKWSVMIMIGNATGMITVGKYLADDAMRGALEGFYRNSLAMATLAFAIALVPSIMGAVALGMAPRDKAIIDGPRNETRALSRNIMIGGIGFIIGLACVIGAIGGFALGVLVEST